MPRGKRFAEDIVLYDPLFADILAAVAQGYIVPNNIAVVLNRARSTVYSRLDAVRVRVWRQSRRASEDDCWLKIEHIGSKSTVIRPNWKKIANALNKEYAHILGVIEFGKVTPQMLIETLQKRPLGSAIGLAPYVAIANGIARLPNIIKNVALTVANDSDAVFWTELLQAYVGRLVIQEVSES